MSNIKKENASEFSKQSSYIYSTINIKVEEREALTEDLNYVVKTEDDTGLNQIYVKQEEDDEDITEDDPLDTSDLNQNEFDYIQDNKITEDGNKRNENLQVNFTSMIINTLGCPTASTILDKNQSTSTIRKQYACNECGKSFSTSQNVSRHKRTHLIHHVCETCDKVCRSSSQLIQHKRTHTGNKLYPCELCDKTYFNPINLHYHQRVHTVVKKYVCDECNKAFSTKPSLNTHKTIHTGQKPYVCDVCNKAFRVSSNLTDHKRVHTGDLPYPCNMCYKKFYSSSNLTKHKIRHNNGKLEILRIPVD